MQLTYLGHSCFLLDINGIKVLSDPFNAYNSLTAAINKTLITADYILLSHAHQDHLANAEYKPGRNHGCGPPGRQANTLLQNGQEINLQIHFD